MEDASNQPETAPEPTNAAPGDNSPAPNPSAILAAHRAAHEPSPEMSANPPGQPRPRGRRQLSQTPEAIRMRERRRRASGNAPSGPPEADRLTPERFAARPAAAPVMTAPVQPMPSPDAIARAERHVAGFIKGVATLVGLFTKPVDMSVPDDDARQTAQLIVEGWPELANASSEDGAKWLAGAAVLGLVTERVRRYEQQKPTAPVRTIAAPSPVVEKGKLPHEPVSS